MAAPNPVLRVSPSGPPTVAKTDPLFQYSGKQYQNSNGQYLAKIGPSNATNPDELAIVFSKGDGPLPTGLGDATHVVLNQLVGDSADFNLGVGTYLCEAQISCGFNTSNPAVIDAWGQLDCAFFATGDAGQKLADGAVVTQTPIPRGVVHTGGGAGSLDGLVHSVTVRQILEVTPAMIAANGNKDLPGFGMKVVRAAGPGSNVYSADSGWLEFTNNTTLFVRKYR